MGDPVPSSSSDSGRAWLWVIEYLASFPQIDPSILHDLIEAAPELPDDVGKSASEVVALRCLEELFGSTVPPKDAAAAPSASNATVGFDFSQRCEDVLQLILQEVSLSDLKKGGAELSKWDVFPFIMHKRASMPKCALQQLKDSILDGSHPCAESLKELSGLVNANNKHPGTQVENGDRDAVGLCVPWSSIDAQVIAPGGNSPLLFGNQNGVERFDSRNNLLLLKTDGIDLANRNLGGNGHENQGCMDDGGGPVRVMSERDGIHLGNSDNDAPPVSGTGAQIMSPDGKLSAPLCEHENGVAGDDLCNKLSPLKRDRIDLDNESLGRDENENQIYVDDGDAVVHSSDGHDGIHVDNGYCDSHRLSINTDAHIMSPDGKLNAPLHGHENGVAGDDSGDNLLPLKRDRIHLADVSPGKDVHENQGCVDDGSDIHPNAKRFKKNSSFTDQYVKLNAVPVHVEEFIQDSTTSMVGVTGKEGSCVGDESEVGLEETRCLVNGEDECVAVKSSGQNPNVNANVVQHSELESVCNASKMTHNTSGNKCIFANATDEGEPTNPDGAPLLRTFQKAHVDGIKDIINHYDQSRSPNAASLVGHHQNADFDETSSDSDECYHERVDIGMKKSHFLSSQCSFGLDCLDGTDWSEQNLCVKCGKGGEMLTCSIGGCPLVVHESCLGSSARFDDEGNFYCPFCAYSLAISDYLEAKKKASLARKKLSALLHSSFKQNRKENTRRSHGEKHSHSKQIEGEYLPEKGTYRTENSGEIQCGQENNGQAREINDRHQFQKRKDNKQLEELSASHVDVNLLDRGEDPDRTAESVPLASGEKKGNKEGEEMAPNCPPARGLEKRVAQVHRDPESNGDNPLCEEKEIVFQQGHTEDGTNEELSEERTNDFEDENDGSGSSRYTMRSRRRNTQYQVSRKRVTWTAEEEEILKEGVEKLSKRNRHIPWRRVLEHGRSVFWSGRTAGDLKNKWWNMCKGSPKSK